MNDYPVYSLTQALDRLSPRARRKYDDLRAALADSEALQRSLQERIRAREDRLAQLAHQRDHSSDPTESARLDAELASVRADLDKLERQRAQRNSVRANGEQVCSRLDNFIMQWFSGASDITVPSWPSVVPGARDGESIGDAIMRLRHEIMIARAELQRVRTAPLPAAEIKAKLVAEIDRMAAAGPRVTVDAGRVVVQWPDVMSFSTPGAALSAPSGSATKLACWLHRDEIIERLTAGIEDAPGSIASAERPQRIRESEAVIFALEVGEERLVVAALDAGLECHRRIDCSPFAILYSGAEEARAEAAE